MNSPIETLLKLPVTLLLQTGALLIALSVASVALTGCGNKGPLVRPSDIPASAPAATEPAEVPPADPASAPAEQPASGTPAAHH